MKTNLVFICLFISIFLWSCKKNKDETTNSNNSTKIILSGITWRDDVGFSMGVVDTTDWRNDDTWSQVEKNLFIGGNFDSNCNFNDTIEVVAFPNPFLHNFILYFTNKDTVTKAEIVIVNQRFEKILTTETIKSKMLNFYLDSISPNFSDTIFRVYYRLTDKNNCVKCGHGDMLRKI